jgi:hypothetical protein
MKGIFIMEGQLQNRLNRKHKNNLHKRIQELSLLNNNDPLLPTLQLQLDTLLQQELETRLLHARLNSDKLHDLPSPALTALISKAMKQNIIPYVNTPSGISHSQHDITQQFTSFFSNLYTKKDTTPTDLPLPPPLSLQCFDTLNLPPTSSEIESIIKSSKPKSAPGLDGLPYTLYLQPSLLQLITRLFTAVWNGASPPSSWTQATIRPILKEDKDPSLPSSYRPISLLNTDYKLFTGIYNHRLQPFLTSIFPPHQTGFIKGRSTHHAALRLSHHLLSNKKVQPLLLDFEKAYDRVSHKWLFHILKHINLPSPLLRVLRYTHKHSSSSLIINNRLSPTFLTASGIRQGDPIAPILFNFTLEPLLLALESSSLFTQAHADDTALCLSSHISANNALNIITKFEQSSGAHLNHNKSVLIVSSTSQPFSNSFTRSSSTERYLGFGLNARGKLVILPSTIPSIHSNLTSLKKLPLVYAAKASILSSYIRPRILYQTRVCYIPPKTIKLYKSMENWFMSSQQTPFVHNHRYMPPPGLTRYHPLLSYRLKPLDLSIHMSRATLLPTLTHFDPSLLPSDLFLNSSWLPLVASSNKVIKSNTSPTTHIMQSFQTFLPYVPTTLPEFTNTPPSSIKLRQLILASLTKTTVIITDRQHYWKQNCKTNICALWKAVKTLSPRQAIITFVWKLINGALPFGSRFGEKCPFCNHHKERTYHILNANCIHHMYLGIPYADPLASFLVPPHLSSELVSPLLIIFSLWITRNIYKHSNEQNLQSIRPTFLKVLGQETERLLRLHPDLDDHLSLIHSLLP